MSASANSRSSVSSALSYVLNLFAACAVLFTATYLIPRFVTIYGDMLGGQPLPPITQFVMDFRWLWTSLAGAMFLAVIYVAWRNRLRPASPLFFVGVILLAGAQIAFVILALCLPLVGTITRVK